MRYGLEIVPFGKYSDPRAVVRLARAAEAAGWEAIALWDHLLMPYGSGDPWVTLAAVAQATSRLRLITMVAPLPRYRPHVLARTLIALDILSEGRLIFGTGLGVAFDQAPFGDPTDPATLAAMLDEGLEVLAGLWGEAPLSHRGRHYTVEGAHLVPGPVQRPRIPVWIGGDSPAALRRAARWDGWVIGTIDEQCNVTKSPERLAAQVAVLRSRRANDAPFDAPFDVAVDGVSPAGGAGLARAYAQAGATWWLEAIFGSRGSDEEMLARISAGPPAA
jgi:alkanesulfonate monooxygenase SsuD/methylene tetrahydromethanopterin reductase-like flavin-dependent oxidoreductase (luciferase family)